MIAKQTSHLVRILEGAHEMDVKIGFLFVHTFVNEHLDQSAARTEEVTVGQT